MTTVHASLIDFRFRMLPQIKKEDLRAKSEYVDVEALTEEDQTFI